MFTGIVGNSQHSVASTNSGAVGGTGNQVTLAHLSSRIYLFPFEGVLNVLHSMTLVFGGVVVEELWVFSLFSGFDDSFH